MGLVDQAREFLGARDYAVEERDKNFFVAEQPGLGGEKELTCVWVLTREGRQGRQQLSLEDEYLNRFRGVVGKYRGARLHLLVDTMEGFSPDFRTQASRQYGVRIQVPVWFFDMPFRSEVARTAASAVGDLAKTAEEYERRRVPQAYERDDAQTDGADLVPDLLREIEGSQTDQEARVWFVVAPAGQGKSVLFSSLFGHLYRRFLESKNRQLLYPRPLPMLPAHIREAAGRNVMGLIDAFLRTDVATPTPRRLFDWMIDNRYGLWMLDGLDEVITRDESFFPYLEDRITSPGARPAVVICVRDSLFQTSDELTDFLNYFRPVVRIFKLRRWDRPAKRVFAWLGIEGKSPRDGDKDSVRVAQFLEAIERNRALSHVASLPFYADLLLDTFKDKGVLALNDEVEVLDLAVTQMCRREYGKGGLQETLLPLPAFGEWLEELAVLSYEEGGVPVSELRELAGLLPLLVTRNIEEEEEQALVEQITMAPFLTRSAASGRVEFTHEILAEYLAGRWFLHEFETDSPRFVSRLSRRPWPPDSILFRVLSRGIGGGAERLASLANAESLTADAFRNLVQLLAMTETGDAVFRSGRILLDGKRLDGVRFHDLNLDGVSFRGCNLTNAEFVRSFLRGARFESAVIKNTRFTAVPDGGMLGASFGNCEHFDSVVVGNRKRIEEDKAFHQWLAKETEAPLPAVGPCSAALQMLHLLRKFVHVDGQARRDWLDMRGITRGKQYPDAPPYEDCVKTALEFGYLEKADFNRVRRPAGSRYGELVTFVKAPACLRAYGRF
jgi:hypothetical protein